MEFPPSPQRWGEELRHPKGALNRAAAPCRRKKRAEVVD